MSLLIINCGNFSSLDNFYQSVGSTVPVESPIKEVILDCTLLNRNKNIRISVLTSLLALCSRLTRTLKTVPKIKLGSDLSVLQFLKDCNFYLVSKTDQVIDWGNYEYGGSDVLIQFRQIACKIISFKDEYLRFGEKDYSLGQITLMKNLLHNEVPRRIVPEFSRILLKQQSQDKRILMDLLTKVISEYVINAILHGKDTAYVAVQTSSWGISVCIADGGLGILSSLKSNYNSAWSKKVNLNTDIDAILNASLKQNIDIGLKESIQNVISYGGYTIVSTGNAEIIWEEEGWRNALKKFDNEIYKDRLQDYKSVLQDFSQSINTSYGVKISGAFMIYPKSLSGTRVFFEIPNM